MFPYITYEEYKELGGSYITEEESKTIFRKVSRNIDSLTYGRIHGRGGFGNLTKEQKEIIKEVCVDMADFYKKNSDYFDNILKSYSINDVSMTFEMNDNVSIIQKVLIKNETYSLLEQTGLCVLNLSR